jgi:hypothetical protein
MFGCPVIIGTHSTQTSNKTMATVIKFEEKSVSKGELAEANIRAEKVEYDCAIPQMWVENIRKRFPDDQLEEFGNLASHFVYVYDNSGKHREEYLMPLTKVGCKILGILALYA